MSQDRPTTDAQALFDRGQQNFQAGEFREAVECFTRAILLRPNVAAGYRYRALAYLEMGQRTDALNDLDLAIRLRSDDPMLYADRARVLFRQQSYAAAIADCDKALALDPGLAPLHGLRGECHAANGDTNRALADFAYAIGNSPEHTVHYLLTRAYLFMDLEDFEAALTDCDMAIKLEPENAAAYLARGLAFRGLTDDDSAETDFTQALALDPTRIGARLTRASVYLNQKRFVEAAADCDIVLREKPDHAKAYELRVLCRKHLQDYKGAFADANEAIRLIPTQPQAYNLRAGLHYFQHQYSRAIQDHLEALKRDPKNAGTFNQLGWIWATAPDPDVRNGDRAKECATRACELTEWQEAGYLDTLAAAHAECGNYDDAVKWMEKAIKLASSEMHDDYHTRLDLYRAGKPVRIIPEPDKPSSV